MFPQFEKSLVFLDFLYSVFFSHLSWLIPACACQCETCLFYKYIIQYMWPMYAHCTYPLFRCYILNGGERERERIHTTQIYKLWDKNQREARRLGACECSIGKFSASCDMTWRRELISVRLLCNEVGARLVRYIVIAVHRGGNFIED